VCRLGFLVNETALEFIDSNHRVVTIGCVRALVLFPILFYVEKVNLTSNFLGTDSGNNDINNNDSGKNPLPKCSRICKYPMWYILTGI